MDFRAHAEKNKHGVISIVLETPLGVDSSSYGKISIHEIFPFSGAFQYSRSGEEEQFIVAFPPAETCSATIALKELRAIIQDPSSEKDGMDLVINTLLERLF